MDGWLAGWIQLLDCRMRNLTIFHALFFPPNFPQTGKYVIILCKLLPYHRHYMSANFPIECFLHTTFCLGCYLLIYVFIYVDIAPRYLHIDIPATIWRDFAKLLFSESVKYIKKTWLLERKKNRTQEHSSVIQFEHFWCSILMFWFFAHNYAFSCV